MGRSRGGLASKLHALVDAEGRPVTLRLTAGQVAGRPEADALTEALGEGDILLARKAWANIPPRADRKGTFAFSRWVTDSETS
jgi:transposase